LASELGFVREYLTDLAVVAKLLNSFRIEIGVFRRCLRIIGD